MFRVGVISAIALVLGALSYGAYWFTQPCHALDRLLGLSGCAQTLTVARFRPVNGAALSPPDASGMASLFGYALKDGQWKPSIVRLDLESRTELFRSPLEVGDSFGHLIFSADGQKAVLSCLESARCTRDGRRSAILAVRDGKVLETGHGEDSDYIHFPGDPHPPNGSGVQLFAGNGTRIIDLQRDGSILLRDDAGQEISVLHEGPRNDVLRSGVSVSPSGQYVAMFDRSNDGSDARLAVWDAISGKRVRERRLGSSYLQRFTPVWLNDGSSVVLLRPAGSDTSIERFRIK